MSRSRHRSRRQRHQRRRERHREAKEFRRKVRRNANRFLPGGLAGRIILMVVGILFVVQLVGWIFGDNDRWEFDEPEEVAAEQVIAATQLLDRANDEEREALTDALTGIFLRVHVQSSVPDTGYRLRPGAGGNFEKEARELLGPFRTVMSELAIAVNGTGTELLRLLFNSSMANG